MNTRNKPPKLTAAQKARILGDANAICKNFIANGVPVQTEIVDDQGRIQEWRLSLRTARGFLATISVKIGMPDSSSPGGS
jgi:hypothetical protein